MPVTAEAAANHVVALSGRAVPAVALSRIVFLAHVAHCGATEGGLLVHDRFFASGSGPVVPRLEAHLQRYRGGPVRDVIRVGSEAGPSAAERAVLEETWGRLRVAGADELARLCTCPGSAWARAYARGRLVPITDRHVFEQYLDCP